MRHFDDYSNSCHEGLNHGLKYNTAPVGPLLNLEHATCILSKNGERKRKQRDKKSSIDAIKTETWSSLKCSKHYYVNVLVYSQTNGLSNQTMKIIEFL